LETRGFVPGPLSQRERALGWFADKIRADLGEPE
jgi:choline monooxygenase